MSMHSTDSSEERRRGELNICGIWPAEMRRAFKQHGNDHVSQQGIPLWRVSLLATGQSLAVDDVLSPLLSHAIASSRRVVYSWPSLVLGLPHQRHAGKAPCSRDIRHCSLRRSVFFFCFCFFQSIVRCDLLSFVS